MVNSKFLSSTEMTTPIGFKPVQLIDSDEWISRTKAAIGRKRKLNIFIDPGGSNHIVWNDTEKREVSAIAEKPEAWQLTIIRDSIKKANREFNLNIKEAADKSSSNATIEIFNVPYVDAVAGNWQDGTNSLHMGLKSGLEGDKYPDAWSNPEKYPHGADERRTWRKIFVHELGHLMGLEHPWDREDGDQAPGVDNSNVETTWTVMGYTDRDQDGNIMTWFQEADKQALNKIWISDSNNNSSDGLDSDGDTIYAPTKFNKKSADKITNFNPSTDTLEIDTDSFGIDSSATFASGKNKKKVKKKLAKLDIDFLYDEKKGGLYFNENGSNKGFGDGGIIAILKGAPDLTSGNLEFI